MRSWIFQILIRIADEVGTINRASMHSDDFMIVEGTTADGREFYVSLNIKEAEKDGN